MGVGGKAVVDHRIGETPAQFGKRDFAEGLGIEAEAFKQGIGIAIGDVERWCAVMGPCDLDHHQPDILLAPHADAPRGELGFVEDGDRGFAVVEDGAERSERKGADARLERELRFIGRAPFVGDKRVAETLGLGAQVIAQDG